MDCKECGSKLEATLRLTGGCSGHGADEYCYCDPADAHVEFRCTNRKCCAPRRRIPITPPELSDQYSIARWFAEHYRPGEKFVGSVIVEG
jgi:hypothetical protein